MSPAPLPVSPPAPTGSWQDAVVVTIPARNEAACVADVVRALPARLDGRPVHALVVDDHSTDGTAEVARAAGAHVIPAVGGQGQGVALRTGYALALDRGAAVIAAMDADGQHQASDLPALVLPVLRGEADVTVGSRILGTSEWTVRIRHVGVWVFAVVMSLATGRRVTDPACGLHAASAAALKAMRLTEVQFHTAEFLVAAAVAGLRVQEVPVRVLARVAGESRKPPTLRYATGFLRTIMRTRWRGRRGALRRVR